MLGVIIIIVFCCVPNNFPIFLHEMDPNEAYDCVSGIHRIKMTITGREREHDFPKRFVYNKNPRRLRVAKVLQAVGYEVSNGTIGVPCSFMGSNTI